MTWQPIFPAALQLAASALLRELPTAQHAPSQGFKVFVQGEPLSAPCRVYYPPDGLRSLIARATGDVRTLALCFGATHWDGFVREECLRQLVDLERPWAVPFIVQLLGEYVIEIVEVIAAALPTMDAALLAGFALENPQFMATTRRRATSYWDCYHRRRFPARQTYSALVALDAIEQMARTSLEN